MTKFSVNSSAALNESLMNNPNKVERGEAVFIWISSVIEIPFVLITLLALCFLIKSNRAASVYVMHLILSDLFQIGCILLLTTNLANTTLWNVYKYCLIVGLFFMACIAIERYVLVSHPHWYRSHHSVKLSCFISCTIWLVPFTFTNVTREDIFTMFSQCLSFFIPYAIILVSFIGTWRGLSRAISLTSHRRKLILGSLSLVLLNYTFLILPLSISSFYLMLWERSPFAIDVYVCCHFLLYLNPLADCLLYLFMRSDAENIMNSIYCCSSPECITANPNSCLLRWL